jgi:peptidoglycan/xylan/chitin deacetylase (PgdA/CDA1 family)
MPFLVIAGLLIASIAFGSPIFAQDCGNPGALGTSRVIAIDASDHRKLGYIEYDETLPLHDREVVLTFDDGPVPPYTDMVLDALAAECVKATFFIVGQQAAAHPALVRRAVQEGHTIGTHTEHHPHLNRMPVDAAKKEIEDGILSVTRALGDKGPPAPFFRFPYFDGSARVEGIAIKMGLTIWNTDLHASDWNNVPPETVRSAALTRLERRKKGILLLHDIHERTALALPGLLRDLKSRGFHIVHAIPAGPDHPKTVAKPEDWLVTD